MKITRRQLRKIILRETSMLLEQAVMLEKEAIAEIKKSIELEALDGYGQSSMTVDRGRLHAIIADKHTRDEANAVITQVNKKHGTDFAILEGTARTGRFTVTSQLYLVSGGATEVFS